jgi:polyisoprenyl-phosphate glycosyltransferase
MSDTIVNRVWLFCPVYFDVEAFLVLRSKLIPIAKGLHLPLPIRFVVVDDTAGLDPAVERLREMDDVTVLVPPFNLGHQRAIVFGLRKQAPGIQETDIVVTMDSDGEDKPEDLPRLLDRLLANPEHVRMLVLARRTKRRETLTFKVLHLGFKSVFRLLTGRVIQTGNYAAYRGWVARHTIFHPHFDLCYSSSLLSLSLPVDYVPCERGQRYAGESRMGYFRLAIHGMRMLMPFMDRIAVRALAAGAAAVFLGLGVAVAIGGRWVLGSTGQMPPPWLSGVLLLLAAVILVLVAFSNCVLLFALFSQSQGVSLSALDRESRQVDARFKSAE